jgi:serine/threonine-protein kinase RsbW
MATEHVAESHATPQDVGRLRRWVEELCIEAGTPHGRCADIVLAATEALTNVVMHAYVDRVAPGRMRIRARLDDSGVRVEVEDDGVGLRPRLDSPGAGMGLALIASLSSGLEFTRGPEGRGTLVRMAFPPA